MSLPDYLKTSIAPRLAERTIANLGSGAPPYLSIMGGRFTLIDSAGEEEVIETAEKGIPYIDCVVVDALERESKIYYAKAWEPNSAVPPDCWSDNGVAPSRNAAPDPALGCGPTCAACPKAVWGSATSRVSGKSIPACSKYQKLAICMPGDDMVFLLRVPPNSLGNLRAYIARFVGGSVDYRDVVTRITFVKDVLGTLDFAAKDFIDEDTYKIREAIYYNKKTDLLVGRGDLPREGLPAPETRQISVNPEQRQEPAQQIQQTTATQAQQPAAQTPAPAGRRRRAGGAVVAAAETTAQATAPFREQAHAVNGSFGIQAGVAPNAELSASLNNIFGNK